MSTESIIETLLGAGPNTALAQAIEARKIIFNLSQAAHDAVLRPSEPGIISHSQRASLAERMARHHKEPDLAARYAEMIDPADDGLADIRDLSRRPTDIRLAAIVAHVDLLTLSPRDATRGSIEALKAAGVSEPDIVRLSELTAFVSYQVRVIAGLRLLKVAA